MLPLRVHSDLLVVLYARKNKQDSGAEIGYVPHGIKDM